MTDSCLFYSSYNVNSFLRYSESPFIFNYSFLGICKYKLDDSIFLYYNYISIHIHKIYFPCNSTLKYIISLLSRSFISVSFGFFSKYRIKGLGHRIYIHKNTFLYKIGYSHLLYRLLDYNLINMKKRFKKETYFAVRGLDYINLRRSIFIIQSYRIPNCYCFNGIFIHGLIVDAKESKRGFLL
jgi:hypothetical protein